MIIIWDNGHGIETAGKRSPVWADGTQMFEYEFTRDIVKRCNTYLKNRNYETYILVPELNDISRKERIERANRVKKDSILLSIHANAGGGTGHESFTTIGPTKADLLAEYIYDSFSSKIPSMKMRTDKTDGDKDKEKNFDIIYGVWMPAVLIECGFMDNYENYKFMSSEEGRTLISEAISEGIINYIKNVK